MECGSFEECKKNLAGLYIQIEAKKRRIYIINRGNHPEMGGGSLCGARPPGREAIQKEERGGLQSIREAAQSGISRRPSFS
jgi:hypothetical protein